MVFRVFPEILCWVLSGVHPKPLLCFVVVYFSSFYCWNLYFLRSRRSKELWRRFPVTNSLHFSVSVSSLDSDKSLSVLFIEMSPSRMMLPPPCLIIGLALMRCCSASGFLLSTGNCSCVVQSLCHQMENLASHGSSLLLENFQRALMPPSHKVDIVQVSLVSTKKFLTALQKCPSIPSKICALNTILSCKSA